MAEGGGDFRLVNFGKEVALLVSARGDGERFSQFRQALGKFVRSGRPTGRPGPLQNFQLGQIFLVGDHSPTASQHKIAGKPVGQIFDLVSLADLGHIAKENDFHHPTLSNFWISTKSHSRAMTNERSFALDGFPILWIIEIRKEACYARI